ncbi:MAG: ComEC/Rec2 family competence protein [Deltaproteobacteria bacterium]|nr:ComEC/Rec2 family competence protein [Deltaproteobacteria bacterium]
MRRTVELLGPLFLFLGFSFGSYIFYVAQISGLFFIFFFWVLDKKFFFSSFLGFCFALAIVGDTGEDRYYPRLFETHIYAEIFELSDVYSKGLVKGYAQTRFGNVHIKLPLGLGNEGPLLREGARIHGVAKCEKIRKSLNPFSFSHQAFYKKTKYSCKFKSFSTLAYKANGVFEYLGTTLKQLDDPFGIKPLLLSFCLGQVENLQTPIKSLFKETGLYHLLVLSGFQLMVIWSLIERSLLLLRYNAGLLGIWSLVFARLFGILIVFLYCLFVGLDKPLLRALIFICLAQATFIFPNLNPFLGSAYLVAAIEPGAQFTMSYLLSFGALLGFAVASQFRGCVYFLASAVLASTASAVVFYFFGHSPDASWIFFNLLFGWVFSVISTALALVGICEFLFFNTDVLWTITNFATYGLVALLRFFYENSNFAKFDFCVFVLIFLAVFFLHCWSIYRSKLIRNKFRRQKGKFFSSILCRENK